MIEMPQILIAEDDIDDLELTRRALSRFRQGLHIKDFRNGASLVEYLESFPPSAQSPDTRPQLLLLDIKMPLMDGLEVLERVQEKALCTGTPIVVFSSSQEPRDVALAYARGASSFVRKPGDYEGYMGVLRQVAGYWLETNLSRAYF